MSMAEKIKAVEKSAVEFGATIHPKHHKELLAAIAAALAEAEKVDRFEALYNDQLKMTEFWRKFDTRRMAEWTRAREAWNTNVDDCNYSILDQFFGGGEGEG